MKWGLTFTRDNVSWKKRFLVVLYRMVLIYESTDSDSAIQMKATEQHFPVVLFIMLYKVVLSYESVDEILKYDHSNESYWAVLSCGAVYYAVQGGSKLWVCRWDSKVWPFRWKLLSSTFLWYCLLCCTRWFYLLSPWMKSGGVTIQMKATEQYLPVVLFMTMYKF